MSHRDPQFAVRLARLFLEAEFLAPEFYNEILIDLGAEDQTWGQFFEQDVTQAGLRLRARASNKVEAVDRLASPIAIHLPEIIDIATTFEPNVDDLLDVLVEHGGLSRHRAETMRARAADGPELLKVLIDERALSPRAVSEIVESSLHPYAQLLRVQAASDILVYNELLDPDKLAHATDRARLKGHPLFDALEPFLDQETLAKAVRDTLDVPRFALDPASLPPGWQTLFPFELLDRNHVVPIECDGEHCTLAVRDALDFSVADTLSILSGLTFSLVQADGAAIEAALFETIPQVESGSDVADSGNAQPARRTRVVAADIISLEEMSTEELPAVDIVRRLLESAVNYGATDIHIERMSTRMRVRFRVDGTLRTVLEIPPEQADAVVSRIKVLSSMDVTERRHPQDGHFSVDASNQRIDFRVSTLPSTRGEKVVLRVLDAVTIVRTLEDLGLLAEHEASLRHALTRPYGLILATGPTGSGKTTTLYAGLALLNTAERNIITIEDPVEYRLDGITQVQVDVNIELTFAGGLRASLRQDPDVILVGEVRDPETASIAVRASLTGHLVLSTLHSNTALGAISALRFLGIKSYMIASSLLLVEAQRLARRVCADCREVVATTPALLRDLGLGKDFKEHLFRGSGCQKCFSSGYRGRTGLYEFLEVDGALRMAIAADKDEEALHRTALASGFKEMSHHARRKLLEGVLSPDETLQYLYDRDVGSA